MDMLQGAHHSSVSPKRDEASRQLELQRLASAQLSSLRSAMVVQAVVMQRMQHSACALLGVVMDGRSF